MRCAIYLFGGRNAAPTFEKALVYAKLQVDLHYDRTGSFGESYAVIFDGLTHHRWLVYVERPGVIRYKSVC